MLNHRRPDPRSNERVIRSLTDDPERYSIALGCPTCPHRGICGGLSVSDPMVDCFELCCANPESCTRVCRNNPQRFVDQVREIAGFDLGNVSRTESLPVTLVSDIIPLVYHGGRRGRPLAQSVFALRLADLIDFRSGELRFRTRGELCRAFQVDSSGQIVLTGVNHDHLIEPWWALGDARRRLIQGMRMLGIAAVTAPNFSLVLDNPRTNDLHAIKRIAITFAEFQEGGIPCAVHCHGRTSHDFERWRKFIAEREEVSMVAYEFTTGPGTALRKHFHLSELGRLAQGARRDLDIIIRGDPQVIPSLRRYFRKVIYIDTTAFMKTMKRQRAERVSNSRLEWISSPTAVGEDIDTLFDHNISEQTAFLRAIYYGGDANWTKAE